MLESTFDRLARVVNVQKVIVVPRSRIKSLDNISKIELRVCNDYFVLVACIMVVRLSLMRKIEW